MPKAWQWDMRRSDEEIREILKDPKHPSFLHYAALLFARINIPKEVFSQYLGKEDFCVEWQKIKRRMRKDRLNQDRVQFWEEIHRHVKDDFRAKGVKLRKSARKVSGNSLRAQVGGRIRKLRQSKKITQAELAREAGISQQFLSKIEQGTENISLDTLERIQKPLKESLFGENLG
jgi:DNA-binding XRE family transcriptional regulator